MNEEMLIWERRKVSNVVLQKEYMTTVSGAKLGDRERGK